VTRECADKVTRWPLHVIATNGYFYGNGSFLVSPGSAAQDLEGAFRYEVFKMLKAEGRITDAIIDNMMHWRHSGLQRLLRKADMAP